MHGVVVASLDMWSTSYVWLSFPLYLLNHHLRPATGMKQSHVGTNDSGWIKIDMNKSRGSDLLLQHDKRCRRDCKFRVCSLVDEDR